MGNESTQPGCEVSASLWKEFREDVRDRRGRVKGVLGAELETAIREYLDGAKGGDVTDELRRLREDFDALVDELDGDRDGGGPASGREKEKNPDRVGKIADDAVSDGGRWVDDTHLEDDEEEDDRSVVQRRTDRAVAELVTGRDQFMLDDLDAAIREGAGVDSDPSIRKYRERVFDRLGGKSAVVHPAHEGRSIDRQVFFVDSWDADVARANRRIERGATLDAVADELDADREVLRDALPDSTVAALRVREDDVDVETAAEEFGTDAEFVEDALPG